MVHYLQENLNSNLANVVYKKEPVVLGAVLLSSFNFDMKVVFNMVRKVSASIWPMDLTSTRRTPGWRFRSPRRPGSPRRCTYYCDWVDLNDSHRPEVLAKHRRREREDASSHVSLLDLPDLARCGNLLEWPWRCRGWREPLVEGFHQGGQSDGL